MARVITDHQISKLTEAGSVNSEMKHIETQTRKPTRIRPSFY